MLKRTSLALLSAVFVCAASAEASAAAPAPLLVARRAHASAAASDREQDGLAGPVRRVKTETAKIAVKNGKPVEGARAVLETTTYDQKGNRVDNAYFLEAGGTLTGKEVYKYDDKGNIVEMTLHNADGSLLAKEVYAYEFDAVGNWVKMTTSVAIIEGGKVTFEPSEVTYRSISYFLDEGMLAKMSQPAAPSATPAAQANAPATQAAANPAAASAQPAANLSAQPKPAPANASAPSGVAAAQPKPTPAASTSSTRPAQQQAATQQQPAAKPAEKPAANRAVPVAVASLDKGVAAVPNAAVPMSSAGAESGGGPVVKTEAEAPAAPPVRTGPLKPISGGILNGKATNLPMPNYPEMAKRTRASGLVEVEVVIDITGKVISAKAVKGPSLLLQAAEAAAKQARFTPTLLSGQPVRVTGTITYNFTLN
ncbi:MAG TPA: TonB family protein [Pyrinomonadaceae bacterium]|nr:TonB family protein [Pyrinomonadaceae bacterium]